MMDNKKQKGTLLRLFQSDMFSAWMALQYLYNNRNDTGTCYYLCKRLGKLSPASLFALLPQLVHLAVVSPTSIAPVEFLICAVCTPQNGHNAAHVLWWLESYLREVPKQLIPRVNRLISQVQTACFGVQTVEKRKRRHSLVITVPDIDDLPAVQGTILGLALGLLSFSVPEASQLLPLALMESKTVNCADILASWTGNDNNTKQMYCKTPFPSLEQLHSGNGFVMTDSGLDKQRPTLLYSNEQRFISSLIQVAKRIAIVPGKESRQRALHAELDLIDHNLPAEVCVSLWCNDDTLGHCRVCRIPATEGTILNSAERVPFLVFIEVVRNVALLELEIVKKKSSKLPEIQEEPIIEQPIPNHDHQLSTDQLNPDTIGEQMRLAAIMLAQLNRQAGEATANHKHIDDIRGKLLKEIERLGMASDYDLVLPVIDSTSSNSDITISTISSTISSTSTDKDKDKVVIRDDPSAQVFTESFQVKSARIRASSPFGHLASWSLVSAVVKAGVDMRQELFACQLIHTIQQIWHEEGLLDSLWTSTHHNVVVAGPEGGLLETIPDCVSVHSIKKASLSSGHCCTLKQYYTSRFGSPSSDSFKAALLNFVHSLAAYSLICYCLHIKDRHNGNILVNTLTGHLVHIDFGFMLTNAPGGSAYVGGFESAPFKLTVDYLELLGNTQIAPEFVLFRSLFMSGLLAIRKHNERLVLLLESTLRHFSGLPCFNGVSAETVVGMFKGRLFLGSTDRVLEQSVDRLISSASNNMFTRLYDSFQYYSNGIL